MPNFFSDNPDLVALFEELDLKETVSILEHDFVGAAQSDDAPGSYEDATDLYRESLDLLGRICAELIAPLSNGVDEQGAGFTDGKVSYADGTRTALDALSEAGFMGVIIPREYGGLNFPATVYMMMIEILSRADASLMTMFGYQDVGEAIAKYGTPEQARSFLTKYTTGEHLGAMVLSEPGAGSDLQGVKLKANQDEAGNWSLNGTKHFISNGCGDVLLVLARNDDSSANAFGLSLFAVHRSERVQVCRIEEKMGLHGSPTCELYFDDAPAELIGRQGMGLLKYVLAILNHARFSVAAQGVGIAEAAYSAALEYSRQRKQFGQIIGDMPQVAEMLASMRTRLYAARTLLYAGSVHLDVRNKLEEKIEHDKQQGIDVKPLRPRLAQESRLVDLLSPMTKYWTTEAANSICYDAQQVFGGLGYMREYNVERYLRDVRITTIYEGTTQVQVGSCVKGVLDGVLDDEFDQLMAREHSESLDRAAQHLRESRTILGEFRELIADSENDIKLQAARQITDTYAGIYAGCLMLARNSASSADTMMTLKHCADTRVKAAEALEGLKTGRWQSLPDLKNICGIAS